MKFVVAATIMLQVLAVGTRADPPGLLTCVHRPLWLVRIVAAMFVGVPLLAAAPLLPRKLLTIGVNRAFADSLSAVTMVLAIPLVPITAATLGAMFGREMVVSPLSVAGTLAKTFLVPFAVGIGLKAALGERGVRIGDWANTMSTIMLAAIVLVLIAAQFGTILPLLWQSMPIVVAFAAGSLLIGHVIGGPDPRERSALAIATVTRHPGLALLIATASFPSLQVLPPILSLIIGCAIVSIPYTAWRKRIIAADQDPALLKF